MTKRKKAEKRIRVGVVGVSRGTSFARGAGPHLGMKLVALCDTWAERLDRAGEEFGVATYRSYDEFLQHDIRPETVLPIALDLIGDTPARQQMVGDLAAVRDKVGPPGASDRAAQEILDLLRSKTTDG